MRAAPNSDKAPPLFAAHFSRTATLRAAAALRTSARARLGAHPGAQPAVPHHLARCLQQPSVPRGARAWHRAAQVLGIVGMARHHEVDAMHALAAPPHNGPLLRAVWNFRLCVRVLVMLRKKNQGTCCAQIYSQNANTMLFRPIPQNFDDDDDTGSIGIFRTFLIFGTAERTPFARKTELKFSRGKTLTSDPYFCTSYKAALLARAVACRA